MFLLPSLITALTVLLYLVLGFKVGQARGKYGIKAPATTGDVNFERVYRVHANTLESMAIFLPALWLFAVYASVEWATGLGVVWLLSRVLYARAYSRGANRELGFGISILASTVLLFGGLGMIVRQLLG